MHSRRLASRHRQVGALLLAVVLSGAGPGCDARGGQRPNVVLIVLDTTRADVLSAYGSPKPTTPRIDALAREGVRFDRAFSTDFWTLPAHASLMTGRHPGRVGATSETNRLPDTAATLAELLRAAGLRTAAFVSNAWVSAERGFAQGFETFEESWRGGESTEWQLDERTVAGARRWLAERIDADEPFFLFVNLNSAHLPYSPDPLVLVDLSPDPRPPARVARLREVKGMWSHLGGAIELDEQDYVILRELYEAEVAAVDGLVGELVDALAERGELDDTLVIVTSDHGENIGDHGMIDHLLSMYDTTLRVPLVVRHPARFPAGRVDDRLVSLVDVVPTVLDVVGVPEAYADGPGRSLADSGQGGHAHVFAENDRPVNGIAIMESRFPAFDTKPLDRRVRTLRTDTHKLIRYSDGEVVLYDLRADPGETQDVSAEQPVVRDALLERLAALDAGRRVEAEATPQEGRDPAALEQLRSLGYIE